MRGNTLLKTTLSIISLTVLALGAGAQRYDRGYSMSNSGSFVKKGTWMAGGTASYSFHNNEDYNLLIIEDINSTGYGVNVSPAFCYMVRNNMGIGMRVEYGRNMLKLDDAHVDIEDVSLDVKDYHWIKQMINAKFILRNYIPLGDSKRFAMFTESQLSFGYGQAKVMNGNLQYPQGAYDDITNLSINLCPGLMAFADEHFAIELSLKMLGLSINHVEQTKNQVYYGSRNSTAINFRINVLTVGFGLYYYL